MRRTSIGRTLPLVLCLVAAAVIGRRTLAVGDAQAPAVTLVRGPYLQQVQDRSAIVVWASREPGPATVRIGSKTITAATTYASRARTGLPFAYYQHEATVTGLSPATEYAYSVYVGGVAAPDGRSRLKTAPPRGEGRVTFLFFSDSGTGSPAQHALASLMAADRFDFATHGGDVAYGNDQGTGNATYATFQRWFFDIYGDWLRRQPMYPSMGNHDSRPGTNWGQAYLDLFVLPEDAGASAYPDHAERYYSFDYGPVHVAVLDTERAFSDAGRRAAQLAWLENDLRAASAQPWKIAVYHKSPYSSGSENGSDIAVREAFTPLFERYGVQLSLSGHEHGYERSIPWRAGSGAGRQAVTYIVSGGGGGPLYGISHSPWTAWSGQKHHYMRIHINGCTATLAAVDTTGRVFDSYALDRCRQAADAVPPTVAFATPASGATVSGAVSVEADVTDDERIEKVDLWVDGRMQGLDTKPPYRFSWSTAGVPKGTHTLELRAYDIDNKRTSSTTVVTVGASTPPGHTDVVRHAVDVGTESTTGDWALVPDSTAADGIRLWNRDRGVKYAASATPAHYFDITSNVTAGVPYHLWLRLKADGNRYSNDSVSVQFSGAVTANGTPVYRLGSASAASVILEDGANSGVSGWGWSDNGYGGFGAHLYFAESGPQTIRVQAREDGVSVDQIVLSPSTYLTQPPGAAKQDATILGR